MNHYQTELEAIIDLHERGFVHDFQLTGLHLVWIQEKVCIKAGNFSIVEYHRFNDAEDKTKVSAIFGILALEHNIKGILIDHSVSAVSSFSFPQWSNKNQCC